MHASVCIFMLLRARNNLQNKQIQIDIKFRRILKLSWQNKTNLEELEDCSAVVGDHFEQCVEVGAVRSLAVRCAEGKGEEIQHGRYHKSTGAS